MERNPFCNQTRVRCRTKHAVCVCVSVPSRRFVEVSHSTAAKSCVFGRKRVARFGPQTRTSQGEKKLAKLRGGEKRGEEKNDGMRRSPVNFIA